jgi:tRNA/tmRNA/rRNA uracil-C5-methylase (TrmA/RlmC/RlmD family)
VADLELEATAMAAGGAAIARDSEGRVVFVEGALPGERVRATLTDERKDFARAVAVEILDASPDRVAPPCAALADGCGGCPWQHVERAAQRRLKVDIVRDALRRIAHLEEVDITIAAIDEPVLRTTARLGVLPDGRAGHRRHAAHDIIGTDECAASHPLLEELIVHGRYRGAEEVLLRVGVASGERMVYPHPRKKTTVRVPIDVRIGGAVHEDVNGRTFRISAASFFQPGPVAASALVDAVTGSVGDALSPRGDGHLVDAYAGVGLFGSVLGAAHEARVTAIEQHRVAAGDAAHNLADLDAQVVNGEVGRWQPDRRDPVDVVVADPARSGLGRPGVAAIARAHPRRLVLVSCDPASLARDVGLLAGSGLRLETVELVDTFPDTFHVETVARFDRFP